MKIASNNISMRYKNIYLFIHVYIINDDYKMKE